jgi:hypothetical protein
MGSSESFASPIERRGESFPRLLMEDYGTLEEACRVVRRHVAKQVLDECDIKKPADRAAALLEVERRGVSVSDVDAFLGTKAGAALALKRSLKKAGKPDEDAKAVLGSFDFIDARDLARALVFQGVYAYGEEAAETGSADPLTEAVTLEDLGVTSTPSASESSTPEPTPAS